MQKQDYIIVPIVFTWIGFVCAISFMEAWLKFQAPGITLPLGLGIGRLVFQALNKVEWICALSVVLFYIQGQKKALTSILIISVATLLSLQTFYLLPCLDKRAETIIAGRIAAPSKIHLIYIITEVIKVVGLFVLGISILRKNQPLNKA